MFKNVVIVFLSGGLILSLLSLANFDLSCGALEKAYEMDLYTAKNQGEVMRRLILKMDTDSEISKEDLVQSFADKNAFEKNGNVYIADTEFVFKKDALVDVIPRFSEKDSP